MQCVRARSGRSLAMGRIDWRVAYLAMEGKADQLGIKVGDDDVTQFLKQITGDSLTREAFKNLE